MTLYNKASATGYPLLPRSTKYMHAAAECFELGRLSYNDGDFYHTKLWMDQALDDYSRKKRERDQASTDGIVTQAQDTARLPVRVRGELGDSPHLLEARREEEEEVDEEFESLYWGPDTSKAQVLDYLAFSHYKVSSGVRLAGFLSLQFSSDVRLAGFLSLQGELRC